MWHLNKTVNRTLATSSTKVGFAIINGVTGWKQVQPSSPDGVTNVMTLLSLAKANNRKVDVFINANKIQYVILK